MIEKYNSGIFFTNTYVVSNGNEAIVIDPGLSFKENAKIINSKYNIKAVLITHGHLDHLDGARYFDCPIYIGSSDLIFFEDDNLSLYKMMNIKNPYKDLKLDIRGVKDKDVLKIIDLEIKVIYTPGHTNGSVCYLIKNYLFTGDSLFVYGIPRTDFPTGDMNKLTKSFKKLFKLNDDIKVYPGHDDIGNIAMCKKNIDFIK